MEKESNKESNVGRPTKYRHEYCEQAYELCLLGYTDKQLAEHFEVNEDTINEWKKKHKQFAVSLKDGKSMADAKVAVALHKRAIGFYYDEVTYEKISLKINDESEIKTEAYKRKVVTKTVVPDAGAAALWLKNRQKELWHIGEIDFSKMTDEQLEYLIERLHAKAKQSNP